MQIFFLEIGQTTEHEKIFFITTVLINWNMYIPIYAAQCIARLSFLSNALILAPLDNSKLTIWDKEKEKRSSIYNGKNFASAEKTVEENKNLCVFRGFKWFGSWIFHKFEKLAVTMKRL